MTSETYSVTLPIPPVPINASITPNASKITASTITALMARINTQNRTQSSWPRPGNPWLKQVSAWLDDNPGGVINTLPGPEKTIMVEFDNPADAIHFQMRWSQ